MLLLLLVKDPQQVVILLLKILLLLLAILQLHRQQFHLLLKNSFVFTQLIHLLSEGLARLFARMVLLLGHEGQRSAFFAEID